MFIMVSMTYPPDKAVQVSRKSIEQMAKPLPSFMRRSHMLTTVDLQSGIKGCSIYEVDDAKIKDAVIEIVRRLLQLSDIEGFRYQIEPMLTVEEAIPLLGT